jgi:hypothetical protein
MSNNNDEPDGPVALRSTSHKAFPASRSLSGACQSTVQVDVRSRITGDFLTYVNGSGETKAVAAGSAPITSESNLVEG